MGENEDEAGDIRKKKLEVKQAEEQLKTTLRMALDESAYARLMNVSLANKEFYITAARHVLASFKRIERKITEREVLMILRAIKEQNETKTSITFHKK